MNLVDFIVSGDVEEPVVVNTSYVMAIFCGGAPSTSRILLGHTSPQTEIVVKGSIVEVCQKLTRSAK